MTDLQFKHMCGHKDQAVLDVVFIHGLTGHPEKTWTNNSGDFWPCWLAEDSSGVSVYTAGYPSSLFEKWSKKEMDLHERASSLVEHMVSHGIGTRAVAFICHSLGGLLAKEMLRACCEARDEDWNRLGKQLKLVAFIATPHTGAALAGILKTLIPRASSHFVDSLTNDSGYLNNLNNGYRDLAGKAGLTTIAYYEKFNTRNLALVVSANSADPGCCKTRPIPIDADHFGICKPNTTEAPVYVSLRRHIGKVLEHCRPTKNSVDAFPAKEICRSVLADTRITHLPAVFESEKPLPLATTYVDLALIESSPRFQPSLLERFESPGERLRLRETRLRRPRQPAKQVLDVSHSRPSILIGGPGSGKSSLMRRIAVDVAEGNWAGATTPLFVELRRYWARRKADQSLTLLDFALERHLPRLTKDTARRDKLVAQIFDSPTLGVLLLADGLDEISAIPDAVDTIYEQLDSLAGLLPWIATSRPTGLRRHCGGARVLELEPLSIESVEQLVKVWSKASRTPEWFPGRLFAEIAAQPSLRQMSGNPFLLTALCYLRHADLDRPLPESRAALYQRLFDQIALQAQRRYNDESILDAEAIQALEDFSRALYEVPDEPRQIFSLYDWQTHGPRKLDFHRRILPARLITSLNEIDSDYHFLHLSLQEHLIARALLRATPPNVAELRFSPAWRAVIRAYGALLYQTGMHKEFRVLVRQLFEERDLLGMSVFHLAEIFADAGIRDTSRWIDDDLRETLWKFHEDGWDEVSALAREALQSLDSKFLEIKGYLAFENLDNELDGLEKDVPEDFEQCVFPGEPYQQYGFDGAHAPRVLASARTDDAHRDLRAEFLGKDQRRALAVATAFADIARPSDRAELAALGSTVEPDSDLAIRLFAYAIAAPSSTLVPFLARFAEKARVDRDELWDRVLELMISIGGELVVKSLFGLLNKDIEAWEKHPIALRDQSSLPEDILNDWMNLRLLLNKLRTLDACEFSQLHQLAEEQATDQRLKEALANERFWNEGISDEVVLALLDKLDCDAASAALLSESQRLGKAASRRVRTRLFAQFSEMSIDQKELCAVIEAASIATNGLSIGVDACTKEAARLWASFRKTPDPDALTMLISRLDGFLAPARIAQSRAALPLIHEILSANSIYSEVALDPSLVNSLIESMLNAVTNIFDGEGLPGDDAEIVRFTNLILELMFAEEFDVTYDAAVTLGYINLPALLSIRGASNTYQVLEEISAQLDVMIFDNFWAGPNGVVHRFDDNRPRIVCLAMDDRGIEAAAAVGHFLVEHGFSRGRDAYVASTEISAVLLFSPDPDEPDPEFAKTQHEFLALLRAESACPEYRCDLLAAEADPKGIAGALAEEIRGDVSDERL